MNPYLTTIEVRHEAQNIGSASAKIEQIVAAINRKPGLHVQHIRTAGLVTKEEERRAA
jgi:hypothetical protein